MSYRGIRQKNISKFLRVKRKRQDICDSVINTMEVSSAIIAKERDIIISQESTFMNLVQGIEATLYDLKKARQVAAKSIGVQLPGISRRVLRRNLSDHIDGMVLGDKRHEAMAEKMLDNWEYVNKHVFGFYWALKQIKTIITKAVNKGMVEKEYADSVHAAINQLGQPLEINKETEMKGVIDKLKNERAMRDLYSALQAYRTRLVSRTGTFSKEMLREVARKNVDALLSTTITTTAET